MLYQKVGNGGDIFGTGISMINGAVGGYPQGAPEGERGNCAFTIDIVTSCGNWRINEMVAHALQKYPGAYVESENYPDRFIQIADDACQLAVVLDAWTGALYEGWCGQSVHEHYARQGLRPPPNSESWYIQQISFLTLSLEEWIAVMLNSSWSTIGANRQSRPLEQWMLEE